VLHDAVRLPAEFESHKCTYLLWPIRLDNWRDGAKRGQHGIVELANLLSGYEPVVVGHSADVTPGEHNSFNAGVSFRQLAFDDIWVRDTGPLVVRRDGRSPLAVDFRFNSWGGLFSSSSNDDAVASAIAHIENLEVARSEFVVEGGALVTDGRGTLITTEEAILAANRNPDRSRSDVEAEFQRLMNVRQVIWLPHGLMFDESGGHADNVCAFADEQTILVTHTKDQSHPSYKRLAEALDILRSAKNARGEQYRIVAVPLPPETEITADEATGFASAHGTIKRQKGTPLAPSHVNFYVANGVVVVPTFGCSTDDAGANIIAAEFPSRKTVQFPSREFLLGGGAVHCVTRDIPRT